MKDKIVGFLTKHGKAPLIIAGVILILFIVLAANQ